MFYEPGKPHDLPLAAFRDINVLDIVAAGTIARCGYREYTEVRSVFEIMPPAA